MRATATVLACLAVLVSAPPAPGAVQGTDERILAYHSDIAVGADGYVTVTETIQVRAAGNQIQRGIYRDFPVRYAGRDLRRVIVPFEVLGIERDGRPEPYHTESHDPYLRIYAGHEDVFVERGVHTYRLTYRVGRLLGFFRDHDELYYNVTGNEWAFPINEASATVVLPQGVPRDAIRCEAYTGPKGAKGEDHASSVDAAGQALFRATRPLGAGEGLTIVVTWPKGFVAAPTFGDEVTWALRDNGMVLVGLVGLIVVAAYYVAAWARVGRDPPKGVIIPLFEPPEGMGPASVRYLLRMGYDKVCFAATVMDLAVKGRLTIEDDDGQFRLERSSGAEQGDLGKAEGEVLQALLGSQSSITLRSTNHSTFQGAIGALKERLADTHEGRHFASNIRWLIPGVVLSVATLVAVVLMGAVAWGSPEVAFLSVWLSVWTLGVVMLLRSVIIAWRGVLGGRGGIAGAVFLTLFSIPFVGGEVFAGSMLLATTSVWMLPILVLLALLNAKFHHFLKRPTLEGRRLMDLIEGFKMYLGTAERNLATASPEPTQTVALFEAYLPYAVALGVENAWAAKFAEVIERAAAGGEAYSPGWYHGTAWQTLGASGFASSFGSSLASAFSAASTAPGSSSGSGGGGASGGGGGGGGGGGW